MCQAHSSCRSQISSRKQAPNPTDRSPQKDPRKTLLKGNPTKMVDESSTNMAMGQHQTTQNWLAIHILTTRPFQKDVWDVV
jgi:hypothetical protein